MAECTQLFQGAEEKIEVFSRDELISEIYVNYTTKSIRVRNHIDDWVLLPFGKLTTPSWDDYLHLLSSRVFPKERGNCKHLLKIYNLDIYDPDAICRKTHGVMNDDYVWFRYHGEKVTFADVRMRN